MKLIESSHLHRATVIKHDFSEEYKDLREVLEGIDLPLRRSEPFSLEGRPKTPKRQMRNLSGAKKPALFPVDLPRLNNLLDEAFRSRGWTSQPIAVTPEMREAAFVLDLKGDFVKNKVFVEVEFGNIASLHRDLFKFQIANRTRVGDVGVIVAATDRLARFHDQGLATFEAAERLRPYLAYGLQMPLWIIGLEPVSWDAIRDRYNEMRAVCASHDVDCHPYEAVFGPEIVASAE